MSSNFPIIESNNSLSIILWIATLLSHQVNQKPSKVKQYLRLFTKHIWHTHNDYPKRGFCKDTFRLMSRDPHARDVYATIDEVTTVYEPLYVIVFVIVRFWNLKLCSYLQLAVAGLVPLQANNKHCELAWSVMVGISRTMTFTMMCSLLGYAFGKSSDIIYKTKVCSQFEIKDHASTSAIMSRQYHYSKTQCMTSCTRHLSCSAFNFWTINGTCEPLEIWEICLPSNVSKDITLVKLTECQKISPWEVITPAERKLQWMEPGAVGSRHIITVSGNEILRQVARALHGGTYLPGL